jgi:hypothetical protein
VVRQAQYLTVVGLIHSGEPDSRTVLPFHSPQKGRVLTGNRNSRLFRQSRITEIRQFNTSLTSTTQAFRGGRGMKLTKPLQTPRSRYAPNYPEVMPKLLCGQFHPLDQCQSGSLPPLGFPQTRHESVAGLTLLVAPSYSSAYESP